MVISWPAWATNFLVETTASLSSGAGWNPLTVPVSLSGDRFVATNSLVDPPALYRLRKH